MLLELRRKVLPWKPYNGLAQFAFVCYLIIIIMHRSQNQASYPLHDLIIGSHLQRNRGLDRPEGAIPWRLLTRVDHLNNVREARARRSDKFLVAKVIMKRWVLHMFMFIFKESSATALPRYPFTSSLSEEPPSFL